MGKWNNPIQDAGGVNERMIALFPANLKTREFYYTVPCKHCGSIGDVVKYGTYRGAQRYWCKKCQRKFVDNDAPLGFRFPTEIIAFALDSYYEGLSINAVTRKVANTYEGRTVAHAAVYGWIEKYSRKAGRFVDSVRARTGRTWVADETVLKIGGKNLWLLDVLDADSRYLLATHITTSRTTRSAKLFMEKARENATRLPKYVVTDKLAAYQDGIEQAYGADVIHAATGAFRDGLSTQLIERLHGTWKQRTKVMRGLARAETAEILADGFRFHYNFVRPHESLSGKTGERTPGMAAEVVDRILKWREVVENG